MWTGSWETVSDWKTTKQSTKFTILVLPPNSTEAERSFSSTGLVVTKLRSSLADATGDTLCFLLEGKTKDFFLKKNKALGVVENLQMWLDRRIFPSLFDFTEYSNKSRGLEGSVRSRQLSDSLAVSSDLHNYLCQIKSAANVSSLLVSSVIEAHRNCPNNQAGATNETGSF